MVDRIAKRYGLLPHEVLDLNPEQVSYAIACVAIADEDTAIQLERMTSGNGMVFPTIGVGNG